MPSRQIPPAALLHSPHTLPLAAAPLFLLFAVTLLFFCLWRPRKWRPSNKTAPSSPAPSPSPPQPLRYLYDQLRSATASFSPANKLGQGGFGPVFRGSLPSGDRIAVKVLDSSSFQGEIEFRNELALAASMMKAGKTSNLVYPLGFCSDDEPDDHTKKNGKRMSSRRRWRKKKNKNKKKKKSASWLDRMEDEDEDEDDDYGFGFGSSGDDDDLKVGAKRRTLLLVYELMPNGSLQDVLLIGRRPELMEWSRRFAIAVDVSRGLRFLHTECDPPIVHGDIKPSNVLLDGNFSARIADFGLARISTGQASNADEKAATGGSRENGSQARVSDMPSSAEVSPVPIPTSASKNAEIGGSSEFERGEFGRTERSRSARERVLERMDSWKGKDRAEIGSILVSSSSSSSNRWRRRSMDWWGSFDDLQRKRSNEKPRQLSEWWREELSNEVEGKKKETDRKKSKRKEIRGGEERERRWESRSCRSRSRSSRRRDWGGLSSTASMRGTMSYAAPECAAAETVSDKCDVYSFGVLLLVIISGRRPLQVTASPIAEHANLIKWARMLARKGKALELVDKSVEHVDSEEAERCFMIALLCLQREPWRRPSMAEVVSMLTGASDVPTLPREPIPSTRSRRKVKQEVGA